MKLLLDTCVLLWALQAPRKLRPRVRKALESLENSVHVSPISLWEISLKSSIGKLVLQGVSPDEIPGYVQKSGWEIAPLQAATAAGFHSLPRFADHRDPFDRMLVWTAIREGFTFVSRDRALPRYEALGLDMLR